MAPDEHAHLAVADRDTLLVEVGPVVHAPAVHIVGEMIDIIEPRPGRFRVALAEIVSGWIWNH